MRENGLKVFAHDGSGVSRIVTLLIVYISIFVKHEKWNDLEALRMYIKSEYTSKQEPNMQAANRVVGENKSLQAIYYKKWCKANGIIDESEGQGDGEAKGGIDDDLARFE